MLDGDRILAECTEPNSTVYVADRNLNLVFTNLSWQQFACQNRGQKLLDQQSRPNLLESMTTEQAGRWQVIYQLLLNGRLPSHREQYLCSSPMEKRVFELLITPHHNNSGEVGWLVHQTIRVDKDRSEALPERLQVLDESRDRVQAEYQSRILLCDVQVPRYQSSQHQEPLETLGGDLIWCRRYPDGLTDLVHADVAGHGEEAGRLATKIVAILDSIASPKRTLNEILGSLNQKLLETSDDAARFATGIYFRFDRSQAPFQCVNFGHLYPLFSNVGPVPLPRGFPVGIIEDADEWDLNLIDPMTYGTRFLVYSDGITEQFNLEGEMFGVDRLWDSFREHGMCPLDEMLKTVRQDVEDFRGDAIVLDDRTLLALELLRD